MFETLAKQGPIVVQDLQEEKGLTGPDEKLREMGIRSVVSVPLIGKSGFVGSLAMGSVEPNRYTQRDGLFLQEAGEQSCLALENMEAYEEIALLKQRLEHENLYLQEEIKIQHDFEGIIGDSPGIRKVLKSVETVGPTDATVLLISETGTGKELVARALHERSTRKECDLG